MWNDVEDKYEKDLEQEKPITVWKYIISMKYLRFFPAVQKEPFCLHCTLGASISQSVLVFVGEHIFGEILSHTFFYQNMKKSLARKEEFSFLTAQTDTIFFEVLSLFVTSFFSYPFHFSDYFFKAQKIILLPLSLLPRFRKIAR